MRVAFLLFSGETWVKYCAFDVYCCTTQEHGRLVFFVGFGIGLRATTVAFLSTEYFGFDPTLVRVGLGMGHVKFDGPP